MSRRIDVRISRKRLAILWFAGCGILFLILLFQTIFGFYASRSKEAWSWFLPNVIPTLSLIVGVLVSEGVKNPGKNHNVDSFLFWLAFYLSLVYLFAAALTVLLAPFSDQTPLQLMSVSSYWLGPLQGLVAASLGAFFVDKKTI